MTRADTDLFPVLDDDTAVASPSHDQFTERRTTLYPNISRLKLMSNRAMSASPPLDSVPRLYRSRRHHSDADDERRGRNASLDLKGSGPSDLAGRDHHASEDNAMGRPMRSSLSRTACRRRAPGRARPLSTPPSRFPVIVRRRRQRKRTSVSCSSSAMAWGPSAQERVDEVRAVVVAQFHLADKSSALEGVIDLPLRFAFDRVSISSRSTAPWSRRARRLFTTKRFEAILCGEGAADSPAAPLPSTKYVHFLLPACAGRKSGRGDSCATSGWLMIALAPSATRVLANTLQGNDLKVVQPPDARSIGMRSIDDAPTEADAVGQA